MPRGRRSGLSHRPEPSGEETGWWFPWQVYPVLLAEGNKIFRKSVYRRPTAVGKRMKRVKEEHRRKYGELCMGAKELQHEPHYLRKGHGRYLTVDHIVPLFLGGTHDSENLRVVCDWANIRLARMEYRKSKK